MPFDDNTSDIPPVPPAATPAPIASAPQQTAPPPWWPQPQPKPHGVIRKVITYVMVVAVLTSVVLNVYLLILLGAVTAGAFSESVVREGEDDQVVAVYSVVGVIDGTTAARFSAFYREIRDDENVKAIVIRVDSPGGGVSASDQIHQMIYSLRHKHGKKVVISMGGVAASGGYYISAPADIIYAEPTTITGSVGVIMLLPVIKGFLDSHGIDMVFIRSKQAQRWKAAINYFEQPDEQMFKERQALLTAMHEKFEKVVRQGRGAKLRITEVKVTVKDFDGKDITVRQTEPLNGRVYMAEAAVDKGLVDRIGYGEDAVDAAAKLAGLDDPKVVQYSRRKSLREQLGFSDISPGIDMEIVDRYLTPRPMMLWQGR